MIKSSELMCDPHLTIGQVIELCCLLDIVVT
eukprot:UN18217